MENKILEILEQMNGKFDKLDSRLDKMDSRLDKMDSRLDKMENEISELRVDVKDIKDRVVNLEVAASETAFAVSVIKEHVDDIEIDKMSILLLEESMVKIKKDNYIIKKHLGLK